MTIYSKESLENLRQRIDLVDVLGGYLDLKRSGAAYKALCPFHDEKSPSFMIQKGDTHYHCFGCGAHGDAISFLMNHQRLNFGDAVELLAQRFQVPLEKIEGGPENKGPNKKLLQDALEQACLFYHTLLLTTPEGHEALHYLYSRGIDLNFIQHFKLGFAPHAPGVLRKYLNSKSFSNEILVEAGLIAPGKQGDWRDFFSDRIMVPIHGPTGAVIAFSGRKFKEETFGGKYVNTAETVLFKKSKVLFGLNYSRRRIAKEKKAIIVEGQLDALRLIYEGFNITVAGQGTAFGEGHVRELVNLGVAQVYLALDSDNAGQEAAIKIGNLFQKVGVEVIAVKLPPGEDPDSYLRQYGPDAFLNLLEKGKDYLTFLVDKRSSQMDLKSPAAKDQLIKELSNQIRSWESTLMVHESLKKLADLLHVPEQMVMNDHRPIPNIYFKSNANAGHTQVDPDRILESDLLRWMIMASKTHPRVMELVKANLCASDLLVEDCKTIFSLYMQSETPLQLIDLMIALGEKEGQRVVAEICDRGFKKDIKDEHVINSIQKILERNWMQKREQVRIQIQSGRCSEEEVLELTKAFKEPKPAVKLGAADEASSIL